MSNADSNLFTNYIESIQFRNLYRRAGEGSGATGPTGPAGANGVSGVTGTPGPIGGTNFPGYFVPAEYGTIQAAITAAALAGGGNVIILQGTYNESFSIGDNVNLMALDLVSSPPVVINGSVTLSSGTATIRNITINGTLTCAPGSVMTMLDCIVSGSPAVNANCSGFIAKRCSFFGSDSMGNSALETNTFTSAVILENCTLNTFIQSSIPGISSLSLYGCTVTTSGSVLPCITSPIGCSAVSSCSKYTSGQKVYNVVGSLISVHDTVTASDGGGVYAEGPGTMNYGALGLLGSATTNNVSTKNLYPFST